ncbi:MAG: translocation/assembly module TamB domain-containing protein [Verrucomicrobia bacterium]|nr:translocation/assembly module TamB domain-containing protein [Verrucomicrobiota bacterium]
MLSRKLKCKLVKWTGMGVLLAIAGLLAMPVWFGWLLRPVLSRFDVEYASYTRIGYGRFALANLECDLDAARFSAGRIEVQTPPAWLWRVYLGDRGDSRTFVSVEGWRLELKDKPKSKETSFTPLPYGRQKAEKGVAQLQRWVPNILIGDGIIVLGDLEIAVKKLVFENSQLSLSTDAPAIAKGATMSLDLRNPNTRTLTAALPALNLQSSTTIEGGDSDLAAKGEITLEGNQISWSATFGLDSYIPVQAELACADIEVPERFLKKTTLAKATGNLTAVWKHDQLDLKLKAKADAQGSSGIVHESLQCAIVAALNNDSISVSQFLLSTPWLEFESSNRARFNLSRNRLTDPVTIRVAADLRNQQWITATGAVTGEITVLPRDEMIPEIALQLKADSLGAAGIRDCFLQTRARLLWPRLEVDNLEIRLPGETTAILNASVDFADRIIHKGTVKLEGGTPRGFLPETVFYEKLLLSATLIGPFDDFLHSGKLTVRALSSRQLNPIDIETDWSGRFLNVHELKIALAAKASQITARASLSKTNRQFNLQLDALDFRRGTERVFGLSDTATIRLEQKSDGLVQENRWELQITPIQLDGDKISLSLRADSEYPKQGAFAAKVVGLSASPFEDFLLTVPPNVRIDDLDFSGGWTNGPVVFHLESAISVPINEKLGFSSRLDASGGSNGIDLKSIEVFSNDGAIAEGHGNVPLTINLYRPEPLLFLDPDKPLRIQISTKTNESFWSGIGKLSQLSLQHPMVNLEIGGTIKAPDARLNISVEAVALSPAAAASDIPPLRDLQAGFELAPQNLQLKNLSFSFQEQSVTAHAEMPIDLDASEMEERLQWRKAKGRIQIHEAELRKIAIAFPNQLSPQGKVNLDLEILPNLQLDGELRIDGAATRPLPTVGSIQEIRGRILFQGQRIVLESLIGSIGGSDVEVSGFIDLSEDERRQDGLPLFDLKIRSENTPLVRRPDLVLRSDLDLAVSNATNPRPVVSGSVRLRESFFLSDVQALQPGKVKTPSRRPPYFSVESPPLSEWLLQLKVEGDRFMRIQSPVFDGRASAALTLENTLREPIALGEVTLNEGSIQFPFAKLQITQGFISLTSENPYAPQLLITANSPVFGYDVKMSVKGSANEPVIELSSTPSLSSEQIMLMMTAGELPKREITFTNQQKATRMGIFLGRGLLSKFGSGSGAADRLTIRSGERISSDGKQTYSVEYRLTDHWSLVGEYDRFSEFNADLKWKLYSR